MLALLDVLLVLGLTLRFTRLVIVDDVGGWWLRGPAFRWAGPAPSLEPIGEITNVSENDSGVAVEGIFYPVTKTSLNWKQKLVSGLTCPFCIGFWIGCAALASLAIVGGPGHAWEPWRWVAGAFTLNWFAAHLGSRLGDAGYAEDDR